MYFDAKEARVVTEIHSRVVPLEDFLEDMDEVLHAIMESATHGLDYAKIKTNQYNIDYVMRRLVELGFDITKKGKTLEIRWNDMY